MAINTQTKHLYEFGEFCLNATEKLLLRDGKVIPLPPKVFETLLVLVESGGHVLEKDELISTLWPDSFVEESSLSQNIFQVRKALGEGDYIETLPRRGYRFIAPVREVWLEPVSASPTEVQAKSDSAETQAWLDSDEWLPETVSLENEAAALPVHSLASHPAIPQERRRSSAWSKLAIAAVAIGAVVIVAFGIYRFIVQRQPAKASAVPFHYMRMSRLTSNGHVLLQAVSPDGKYIAQVVEDAGQQGLWIRQAATGSSVQLVPATDGRYLGVTFSRDGNYIYYSLYATRPNHLGELFQIPALGGTAKRIVSDVDSAVTVSPDGKQLAFIRNFVLEQETAVIVVNADGTGERKLATRKRPNVYTFDGISWSPDGKVIALAVRNTLPEGRFMNIVGVNVDNGSEFLLTSQRWNWVSHLAWMGDGSGVVAIAWHPDYTVFADQLWYVSWPRGETRRITNDLNGYFTVSIADDLSALTTVQSTRLSSFWVVPSDKAGQALQITSGFGDNYSEVMGMTWLGNNRIVYGSNTSGNTDLWVMDADGRNQKQLTTDGHSDIRPVTSTIGDRIAYVSYEAGIAHLWMMNSDGSEAQQLTRGEYEIHPSLSPDGKWIVYVSGGANKQVIWKKPIDGGEPVRMTDLHSTNPVVSPDGKWIGCFLLDVQTRMMRLAVVPFEGGAPRFICKGTMSPDHGVTQWSPDSRSLTFIRTLVGVSNIWAQPIDGSEPKQLTGFRSDRIYRFAWSPDGKHLACERGVTVNDLVMVTNFAQSQ